MSGGFTSLDVSLAIIPKIGGTLSIIACVFIIRDVIRKWKHKRSVPLTSVLVFCISVADLIFSFFAAVMSTW
jgi:hypothetical protein